MIDLVLVAVVAVVTWFVASEGAWSAGVTFLCVLLSGLLAMNFFEPATLLASRSLPAWDARMDMICLVGLFAAFVSLFRLLGERFAPTYVALPAMVEQGGRWLFGLASGYVTMAFLLTALHTAPVPREYLGFTPERPNLLGIAAPDRQWLGLVQYVTEKGFGRYDLALAAGAPPGTPHAFDAPYLQIGQGASAYPNTIWPSFPIRYAMRREQFSGGATTLQPSIPAPAAPPVGAAPMSPAPSGGGAGPGF